MSKKKKTNINKKRNNQKDNKIKAFKALFSFIIYGAMGILIYILFFSPNAYAIYLGENHIATIERTITEDVFRLNLLARISNLNSNSAIVLIEDVSLVPIRANSSILTIEQALNLAIASSSYYISAATFFIDGREIVTVSSYDEAIQILEHIARRNARGIPENIATPAEIIINNRLPEDNIVSFEMAVSILTRSEVHMEQYTVSHGESLWSIAMLKNTTVENILEQNQGITVENLSVGQILTVPIYRPILTVTFDDIEKSEEYESEEIE